MTDAATLAVNAFRKNFAQRGMALILSSLSNGLPRRISPAIAENDRMNPASPTVSGLIASIPSAAADKELRPSPGLPVIGANRNARYMATARTMGPEKPTSAA